MAIKYWCSHGSDKIKIYCLACTAVIIKDDIKDNKNIL